MKKESIGIILILVSVLGFLFLINENLAQAVAALKKDALVRQGIDTSLPDKADEDASVARQGNIKDILLYPIKNNYKFPESVKLKNLTSPPAKARGFQELLRL